MNTTRDLLAKAEELQELLLSCSTGGGWDGDRYVQLRKELRGEARVKALMPAAVEQCRDLGQFWAFIKNQFGHYAERREYLWSEFRPLLESLEDELRSPADESISGALSKLDADHVHAVWNKALERRSPDPEGAITAARTLLESVCKLILDEEGVAYDPKADLPVLYRAVADKLALAPDQHTQQVFKQILGGCQSIVGGLAGVRNRLSDSHGQGKKPIRPSPRHAELAVNLSGAMATFLVATWQARRVAAA
jgi:Abortive infection C-terminus